MDPAELDRIVDGWIALHRVDQGCGFDDSLFWAYEDVMDLVSAKPEEAFHFILAVLKRDDAMPVMAILSAGPLEDLLAWHGDRVIADVEEEAKRDVRFAKLLGGVWKHGMDDHIWNRVVAIRDGGFQGGHL